jgi:hypothetical protein
MQLELARFTELPETRPHAHKIRSGNRNREPHSWFRHIVNTILVKSEAVRLVGSVYEVNQVLALTKSQPHTWKEKNPTNDIVCQLRENRLALIVREWTHDLLT